MSPLSGAVLWFSWAVHICCSPATQQLDVGAVAQIGGKEDVGALAGHGMGAVECEIARVSNM